MNFMQLNGLHSLGLGDQISVIFHLIFTNLVSKQLDMSSLLLVYSGFPYIMYFWCSLFKISGPLQVPRNFFFSVFATTCQCTYIGCMRKMVNNIAPRMQAYYFPSRKPKEKINIYIYKHNVSAVICLQIIAWHAINKKARS